MEIGAYGFKIAPIAGGPNKGIKKMMISPVLGGINKNAVAVRIMQPNGQWSKPTHIGMLGDVNGDGQVSITDYTLIREHYLGQIPLTGANLVRGDINRDGVVDETDYDLLRDYILNQ